MANAHRTPIQKVRTTPEVLAAFKRIGARTGLSCAQLLAAGIRKGADALDAGAESAVLRGLRDAKAADERGLLPPLTVETSVAMNPPVQVRLGNLAAGVGLSKDRTMHVIMEKWGEWSDASSGGGGGAVGGGDLDPDAVSHNLEYVPSHSRLENASLAPESDDTLTGGLPADDPLSASRATLRTVREGAAALPFDRVETTITVEPLATVEEAKRRRSVRKTIKANRRRGR